MLLFLHDGQHKNGFKPMVLPEQEKQALKCTYEVISNTQVGGWHYNIC